MSIHFVEAAVVVDVEAVAHNNRAPQRQVHSDDDKWVVHLARKHASNKYAAAAAVAKEKQSQWRTPKTTEKLK